MARRALLTDIHQNDPTYLWKIILRVLAIPLALVGIGSVAWAVRTGNNESIGNPYFYASYVMQLPWILIALGFSIIWNIVNIIVLLVRRKWIHPGANVGCDLVLWLALAVTGATANLGSVDYLNYYQGGYYGGGTVDVGYGGGTYANGTQFYYTANGSQVAYCGGVDGCSGAQQASVYTNEVTRMGVVIAVGCAFAYIVT